MRSNLGESRIGSGESKILLVDLREASDFEMEGDGNDSVWWNACIGCAVNVGSTTWRERDLEWRERD